MTFVVSAAPPATTTWNPADKDATITLSNGNLTATSTGASADALVRSTTSKSASKLYYEATMTAVPTEGALGLANASETLTNFLGQTNNSIGIFKSGHIFLNGSNVLSGPSYTAGDILGVAIDFGGNLIWFRNNNASTVWNAGGTANPATGVGGQSIAAITGPFFICADVPANAGILTLNPGNSFNVAAPSGFSAWG